MDAWWVEHRPDATDLFRAELEATFRYILEVRNAGAPWPTERRPNLRRILMRRASNHVYFTADEPTGIVFVYAISGARKARAPKL